jgi:dTDP-4-amino-4,6-dideoxygalactose transaminase
MYEIQVSQRDKLRTYLKNQGIQTGIHYPIPLHLQPAYKHLGLSEGSYPVSEQLAQRILSIPLYPELTKKQQDYIIDQINNFYQ